MSRETPNDRLRSVLQEWWNKLTDAANGGRNANRTSLAALRRLDAATDVTPRTIDVTGAILIGGFWPLYRTLSQWSLADGWEARLVVAAAVLAHVKDDNPSTPTAALLGAPRSEGGDTPRMAESRFRRLLRTTEPMDLYDQGRRAVALLDRTAPVGELGVSLLLWNATVRRDWAAAYWQLNARAGRPLEATVPAPSPDIGAA